VIDLLVAWFALPLSGAVDHTIESRLAWHGRLMVLAWAVLLPLGALAARFFKVLPGQGWPEVLDNARWWHAHRLLQYAGVAVAVGGLAVAWRAAEAPWRSLHTLGGWLVMALAFAQVVGGGLRGTTGGPARAGAPPVPGDHYDMTPRRVRFERVHKALGWTAILLSMGVIVLGLVQADAPRWMLVALAGWWAALAAAFVGLQRAGWCVDTYQAIWGPDPVHPGNRRRPVGPGIRRGASIGQRGGRGNRAAPP